MVRTGRPPRCHSPSAFRSRPSRSHGAVPPRAPHLPARGVRLPLVLGPLTPLREHYCSPAVFLIAFVISDPIWRITRRRRASVVELGHLASPPLPMRTGALPLFNSDATPHTGLMASEHYWVASKSEPSCDSLRPSRSHSPPVRYDHGDRREL
jgi:hypothetical protein